VTLFSLLLGTGTGSFLSRRISPERARAVTTRALAGIVLVALTSPFVLTQVIDLAIPWPLPLRIAMAVALLFPLGVLLGMPLPGGMRLLASKSPELVPWGWGLNGAFSVVGATLAVFIAMNWGFSVTLFTATGVYAVAALTLQTR
jgi:hypothetical protein